ncbi:MAG: ankyrin repeat domain-containing protein [Planctomycetota bacterium]|nr:ankyrin repeat domain-containing protein [Planctomycetota bacterium]
MRYLIAAITIVILGAVVFFAAGRWKSGGGARSKPSQGTINQAYQAINAGDAVKLKALIVEGLDVNFLYGNSIMLHEAATLGQTECVKVLLEAGAKVTAKDANGSTALHRACGGQETAAVVKALLAAGADANAQDAGGQTLLHRALVDNYHKSTDESGVETVQFGGQEIVVMLLAAGANPNLATTEGQSPLHWAAHGGGAEPVAALLGAGADANAKDARGETPLAYALHGSVSPAFVRMVELLLKAKANPLAPDRDGLPPLHLSCRIDAAPIAEAILKAGVDVNSVDAKGQTALRVAADQNSAEAVKVLLAHRADVTLRDKEGKTALAGAAMRGSTGCVDALRAAGASEETWTRLFWAAICGNEKVAAEGDLNAGDRYGYTPLIYASARGDTAMVRDLLAAGASPNPAAADKVTALIAACRADSEPVAAALIRAGAPVNVRDADGWTPLLLAVDDLQGGTVKLLLDAHADTAARRPDGQTALHLAAGSRGFHLTEIDRIAMLLLDAKADPLARDNEGRQPIDLMDAKGGTVHDRFASATAAADDGLLDALLEAASKDTAAPGPAKTPRDALRNYARALYRMDKAAQRACVAGGKASQRLGEAIAECLGQGVDFRRAMIAAYGLTGWRRWRNHDGGVKGDIQFPLYDAEAIRTARITITGETAVYEQPERLRGGGTIGFVREGGQWRIRFQSALDSDDDGEKLAKVMTDFAASMKELQSEIGRPGVTAKDINRDLGRRVFERIGLSSRPK